MSATTPPERHNPKAWANYGCKDSELFWIVQIKSLFGVIFSKKTDKSTAPGTESTFLGWESTFLGMETTLLGNESKFSGKQS